MRSECEEHKDSSSKKEIEDGSSKKDSRRSKTACGSKDLCGSKTIKENKESVKTEEKHHFYRATKKIEINELMWSN